MTTEELRKDLLNDLIEFENGNKTLLMTFNKLFKLGCNQLDKLEAKDKEIAELNSIIDNQHKLMVNAEQRGIDKAKSEITDLKAEIERLHKSISRI